MSKYYSIETYTPYMMESIYHYLSIDDDKEIDDYAEVIDEWVVEDAIEWYNDTTEEDYPDFQDFLNECGYHAERIDYEEYRSEIT